MARQARSRRGGSPCHPHQDDDSVRRYRFRCRQPPCVSPFRSRSLSTPPSSRCARPFELTALPLSTVEMICHTNALEESISAGTTYVDCFRGVDRRRTLVSMAVWASQVRSPLHYFSMSCSSTFHPSKNLCGAVLGSCERLSSPHALLLASFPFCPRLGPALTRPPLAATFFLTSAGMPTVGAYSFNLGIQGLGASQSRRLPCSRLMSPLQPPGLCGTFISWALMPHFDRRTLWIGGLLTLEVLLLIVGGLGFAPGGYKSDVSWGVGACLIGIVFVFDVTVSPQCLEGRGPSSSGPPHSADAANPPHAPPLSGRTHLLCARLGNELYEATLQDHRRRFVGLALFHLSGELSSLTTALLSASSSSTCSSPHHVQHRQSHFRRSACSLPCPPTRLAPLLLNRSASSTAL